MNERLTDEELMRVFEAQHAEDAAIIRMIEAGAEVDAVNAIGARSFWRRFKQDARAIESAVLARAAVPAEPEGWKNEPPYAPGSWVAADDVYRMTREIDVALNGEDRAAARPTLADICAQVVREASRRGRPLLAASPQPAEPDVLRQAVEALEGVVRVADRATVEFDAARAAIASLRSCIGGGE